MEVVNVYRGDVWFIKQGTNTCGVEQMGGRPAVVVSNDKGNHYSNQVEVVYLTSKPKKPLPTHVPVFCDVMSTALCEQITTVDKSRLERFICQCTEDEMRGIDKALMISLGIYIPENKSPSESIDECLKPIIKECLDEYFNKPITFNFEGHLKGGASQ